MMMSLETLSSKPLVNDMRFRNQFPKIFKFAENILRNVRGKKCSIKDIPGSRTAKTHIKAHILAKNVFKHRKIIRNIIKRLQLCEKEPSLSQERAEIMVYKIAVKESALPGNSKAVLIMEAYREEIQELFLKLQMGDQLDSHLEDEDFQIKPKVLLQPQYARIHTLSASDTLRRLKCSGFKQIKYNRDTSLEKYKDLVLSLEKSQFLLDYHFKDLLVFSKGDLNGLSLLEDKLLFMEDKASYIPVHVLNPEPDSTVLVACAVSGIQIIHLASMMKNRGKIYAFEEDKDKFKALGELLALSSVENCDMCVFDFMNINPFLAPCSSVEYILLNPLCFPQSKEPSDNKLKCINKTNSLRSQVSLKRALSFPNVKRVVFSTSSITEEESEFIVEEVYKTHKNIFRLVSAFPDCPVQPSASSKQRKRFFRLNDEESFSNCGFVAVFERIQTADVSATTTKSPSCEAASSKNKHGESGGCSPENDISQFGENDQEYVVVDLTNMSCEEDNFSKTACQSLDSEVSVIADYSKSKPKELTDAELHGSCSNSDVVFLNSIKRLRKLGSSNKTNNKCDLLSNCAELEKKLNMANDDLNSKKGKLCSDSEFQIIEISDSSDEELKPKREKSKVFHNLKENKNNSASFISDHVKKISSPLRLKDLECEILPQLQETRNGQYLLKTNSGVVKLSDWVKAEIKEQKKALARHCSLKNHSLTTEPCFLSAKETDNFGFCFDRDKEIPSPLKSEKTGNNTLPKLHFSKEVASSSNHLKTDFDVEIFDLNECNVKSKVKKKKKVLVQQPGFGNVKKNSVLNDCASKQKGKKITDLQHSNSEILCLSKCDAKLKSKKTLNIEKCCLKSRIKKSK